MDWDKITKFVAADFPNRGTDGPGNNFCRHAKPTYQNIVCMSSVTQDAKPCAPLNTGISLRTDLPLYRNNFPSSWPQHDKSSNNLLIKLPYLTVS